MSKEVKHSGRYPIEKFGVLNHYMVNLYERPENCADVEGLAKELMVLLPGYTDNIAEMKRRLDESTQ